MVGEGWVTTEIVGIVFIIVIISIKLRVMNGVVIMPENILVIDMGIRAEIMLIETLMSGEKELMNKKTQDLKDIIVGVSVAEDFQEMQELEEEHRGEKSTSFGCITWIIIIAVLFGVVGMIDKILPAPLSYIPFALVMYGLYKMHKVFFGRSETNTLLIVLGAMMAFGLFVAALMRR